MTEATIYTPKHVTAHYSQARQNEVQHGSGQNWNGIG